jgi:outer membrane lipoprotein-sorting protein
MAPNDSAGRRRTARYAVPVAVAGVAAATIGLVPALAASGDPELPQITAEQLVEKIAASDVQQLSGTVKVTTDLGLPSFAGLEDLVGAAGAGGAGAEDPGVGKLMELASGTHTLRVAADGPGKQRLDFVDDAAEYSLIRNGEDVWAYDGASREAVHSTEKDAGGEGADGKAGGKGSGTGHEPELPATPQDFAQEALKAVDDTTSVTVDGTARIAGRDAYQLLIKPKQSGSTIGSIKVAVDAEKGVPLKFTLMPSGGGKAAIDAGFTKVDFGAPAASSFAPPRDAKVTEEPQASEGAPEGLPEGLAKDLPKDLSKDLPEDFAGPNVIGEGWTAVAQLSAPGGEAGEGVPAEADRFLDVLGDKVTGKFGSGTVFKTRLVNALLTDDGKLYAGAVTPERLVEVAGGAK